MRVAETVYDQLELTPQELQARLTWARRNGHPQYLWPHVAPRDWRAALRQIERVAATVLRGERARLDNVAPAALPGEPARLEITSPAALIALSVAAFSSGMGPLLSVWRECGVLETDDLTAQLLAHHLWHARARAARMSLELERAICVLADVAPDPLIIKAAHTAGVYFPEPAARPAADIDLVVRREQMPSADAALHLAGYTLSGRQYQPRKSEWLTPASSEWPRSLELWHANNPYGLDLHGSLERNFFGVRTLQFHASDATTMPAPHAAGARILRQPLLFAFLAAHASEGLHNLTLLRITELVLMARRDAAAGQLRWDELQALLNAARAERFVYPALELTERLAPGTIEPELLACVRASATPRMRRVVAQLTPGDAQRLDMLSLDERFMWCAGALEHVRRLVHMVMPAPVGWSPRQLARKYSERLRRLRAARIAVRTGAGSQ